jgi:hypothetical protein
MMEPIGWYKLSREAASRLQALLANPWLGNKLNRVRRIGEHGDYLARWVPGIAEVKRGVVIDVGPGGCELLEIVKQIGHFACGIDAQGGMGGMGEDYLEACRLLAQAQGIPVAYCDALHAIRKWREGGRVFHQDTVLDEAIRSGGCAVLINSRGSMEQVFSRYMDGKPHDLHHMASNMTWRLSDKLTLRRMRDVMAWASHVLRPGGVFLCHLNGSTNSVAAEIQLDRLASDEGLMVDTPEERVHLWTRPA